MVGEGLLKWLDGKQKSGSKSVSVGSVIQLLRQEMDDALHARSMSGLPKNGKVTITPEDLLGASEVADYLQVDRTRPSKWRKIGTTFGPDEIPFPEPYRQLSTGPVWLRSQIEPFIPHVEARRRIRD